MVCNYRPVDYTPGALAARVRPRVAPAPSALTTTWARHRNRLRRNRFESDQSDSGPRRTPRSRDVVAPHIPHTSGTLMA